MAYATIFTAVVKMIVAWSLEGLTGKVLLGLTLKSFIECVLPMSFWSSNSSIQQNCRLLRCQLAVTQYIKNFVLDLFYALTVDVNFSFPTSVIAFHCLVVHKSFAQSWCQMINYKRRPEEVCCWCKGTMTPWWYVGSSAFLATRLISSLCHLWQLEVARWKGL